MDDVTLLESVVAKDRALIENVRPDQHGDPTLCPDYDVKALLDHIAGWAQAFGAAAHGTTFDGDPGAFTTDDPAGVFGAAGEEMVRGWREHGTDRAVPFLNGDQPGAGLLAMTVMEYVTHGCDLALATGQDVPFSDAELEATLARARTMLPADRYRGEGMPFGEVVPVPDDAPAVDRLLGYLGRKR